MTNGGRSLRRAVPLILVVGLTVSGPRPVTAQKATIDVSFDQSYTSVSAFGSPSGFAVGLGVKELVGPLGARVHYRRWRDSADVIAQSCGFASCTPGPFDRWYSMRAIGIGLTAGFGLLSDAQIELSVNASRFRQARELERIDDGERITEGSVSDMGFGPGVALRFPALLFGIRPHAYARYDRVLAHDCLADAACYDDRNVTSFGLGLSWER